MDIILCCGEHGRAVIFGRVEAAPVKGEPVLLKEARMVLEWPSGGLFAIAASGPREGTKITAAIPSTLETVWQEYLECTEPAAAAIRAYRAA